MKEFEFTGFELYSTDGYTHQPVAYFKHHADAEIVRDGDNYMGVSEKKIHFRVFESVAEYYEQKEKSEREATLAKLTPAERRILGLE